VCYPEGRQGEEAAGEWGGRGAAAAATAATAQGQKLLSEQHTHARQKADVRQSLPQGLFESHISWLVLLKGAHYSAVGLRGCILVAAALHVSRTCDTHHHHHHD